MPLPPNNKFAPKAGAAKPAQTKVKPSRYGTFKPKPDGEPMADFGDQRFRLLSIDESRNPGTGKESIKVKVEALPYEGSPHEPGTALLLLFMRTPAGESEFKRLCMAFAGYEEQEEYLAFDPEGYFFDACTGDSNAYAEQAAAMIGRVADCRVAKGNPTGKMVNGEPDYYRDFTWAVVPDDDYAQDTCGKVEK